MVRISPAGLSAAPVANRLSVLATFRERLCRPYCITSSVQPYATVEYTAGTPVLNGTTVFVPVTARILVAMPGCGCNNTTSAYTEQFYVAFQGQTALPAGVTVTSVGRMQNGADVNCGNAWSYSVNDSLTIELTPAATPA